ncbi:ATP-binding protein [Candidatus Viridilinea mediisalina]|uniref:HTH cro/C1-type domain-containing protein n=1 Tax=Candidatus Viridilinea mediisalina TaxID=2024553 RepID=A0A2A6RJ82_9CHLR|nr:tetratricopeptide repeat protein [Candidatus Viridilinea mediisalina]PDW03013.1 hypothetical protein CJ255_11125 [Candidatus Viridilinea mediisalina]
MTLDNDIIDFGLWVKGRREALWLTQAELGRLAGYAADTIRAVEAGRRRPSQQMLEQLADALQLDPRVRERFFAWGRMKRTPVLPVADVATTMVPQQHRIPPLALPELVGRQALLTLLQQYLAVPEVRLMTLVGPPGVGKTRLARALGYGMERQLDAGAAWVALTAVASLEQMLTSMAHALQLNPAPERPLRQVLCEYLQACELLLVLDSIEPLRPAASELTALLSELLAAAPRLKLLVTSQAPLQLAIEHVVAVPPLALEADEDGLSPALQLFAQRAQAADHHFRLTAQNVPVVTAICRELDGLPLALELAATRCRIFAPEVLLERLDQRLQLLTHQGNDRERRHHSLRAALEWSVALLSPAEQACLGALSLFQGGFSLAAAEHVGGTGPNTLTMLEQLLNHSLLTRLELPAAKRRGRNHAAPIPTEPRFAMLESIRLFAYEQLSTAARLRLARSHAAYYLSYVQQDAPLWRQESVTWVQKLEREEANLRAALSYSQTQRDGMTLAALVVHLSPYWTQQGQLDAGRHWAQAALALRASLPAEVTAQLLVAAADLAYQQSDYAAAQELASESFTLDQTLLPPSILIRAHYRLAWIAARQSNYPQAHAELQTALALAQSTHDTYSAAMLHGALGWMARDQGDFAGARSAQEQSLALYRQRNDRLSVAYTLNALGWIARDQGDYHAAALLHRESLQLYQAAGHTSGVALSYNNLGWAAGMRGEYEQAAALFNKSLNLREALGVERDCAWTLSDLGWLWREAGDAPQSAGYYHEALQRYQRLGNRRGSALSHLGLAQANLAMDDPAQALSHLRSACAILLDLHDRRSLARLLEVAAAHALATGNHLCAAERLGAAEGLRAALDTILPPSEERWHQHLVANLSHTNTLGIAAAWARGRRQPLADLLADMVSGISDE